MAAGKKWEMGWVSESLSCSLIGTLAEMGRRNGWVNESLSSDFIVYSRAVSPDYIKYYVSQDIIEN